MLLAFYSPTARIKKAAALVAMAIILIGGFIEPLELDAIEEAFILLPLLYLVLFPGTWWAIVVCGLLVALYLLDLPSEDLGEFTEDAIELVLITSFASIMIYFQKQANLKSAHFKKESETDFLTQIGNRKAFYLELAQFKLSDTTDSPHVLLQINIDNFKVINEQFGQNIGDQLLKTFAQRLFTQTNQNVSLYRIGGDLFSMVLTVQHDAKIEAEALAKEVLLLTKQSSSILNRRYNLTSSIGLAHYRDSTNQVDMWCRNAELAISQAKKLGGNRFAWFDQQMIEKKARRYLIEKELAKAIEQQDFQLVYQPKVHIKKNKVRGVEALIRWQHATLGPIGPDEFIPIAEQSSQIIAIGEWVLNEACEQGKRWLDEGTPIAISINVSTVQFATGELFSVIRDALFRTGFPGKLLQVEITETAIMTSYSDIVSTCQQLRTLGTKIAIDDFGVAYSSLNYLRRLPIDVLKIDKSFVDDCVDDPKAHMLIRTIIQLGHNLNLTVTAEGVESEMQCSLLSSEGCDKYQGYYFSRPIAAEEIKALLLAQKQAN